MPSFALSDWAVSAFRQLRVSSNLCEAAEGVKMMPVSLTTDLQPLPPEDVAYDRSNGSASLTYSGPNPRLNHLYSFSLFGRDFSLDQELGK